MIKEKILIKRDYEIPCNFFYNENSEITHVIIGVHGFAGDKESSMLYLLAEKLVERGGALICFDFPAHGESLVDEEYLTINNCKNDLIEVAKYVSKKYPNANKSIFATSFGGYISLLCFEQLCDFKYILRAPAITMPNLLLETVLKINEEDFKEQQIVNCGFERKIELPYSFYEDLKRQINLLENCFKRHIYIFHGKKDDIVPLEVVLNFATQNEHTEVFIMPDADHRFKNPGELDIIVNMTLNFIDL